MQPQKLLAWSYYSPEFLKSQDLSETILERVWAKIEITDFHWFWLGSTRPCGKDWPRGHGMIQRMEGVNWKIYVHRLLYILTYGPIADDVKVLHRGGDIPYCVRPSHMVLGTQGDNMRHRTSDGKNYFSHHKFEGENNKNSKLTRETAVEMRLLRAQGWLLKDLAEKFHVSISVCSLVVRGERWKE